MTKLWPLLVIFGIVIVVFFGPVYTIDATERGVLLTWGEVSDNPIDPGIHYRIPFMQKVERFNVKTQKYEAEGTAASKDLQTVNTKVAVIYHLNPESVPKIYAELGQHYDDSIIQPTVQEVLKASSARFSAEQLITNRSIVAGTIQDSLYQRLHPYGIIVESTAITDFKFSESFTQAIEAKVTASQQMLKAETDLKRIHVEAQQKVAQAKAEAEALNLQKQAITPELIELRKVEMQTKAVEKWDGKMPVYTGGAMPFMDVTSITTAGKAA
ncbi:MAG: prohibitin family protein [Methanothrix soehngenii]|jgi:regulator of protease activity HflC (stomatin/prohibitin superfamily)|uniref:prohibitin family protein n=1 Tax=Methanothrix soehngenii TaxID=2223 RepID=UPI0023F5237D|nr:prohibitin family protein [Methanothrix soehngenii]MDD5256911.1 prohibitin family protein [Methanothrix soehngenii]